MQPSLLRLRRATKDDYAEIITLIDEAAGWLRTKNTDQWAQPWRTEEDRSHRILRDLAAAKTWILWDGRVSAATITADPEDYPIWPAEQQREPAVYVRRLVVSRAYEHQGLGAELLNWAGLTARQRYGSRWIRVDVWRTNKTLHAYYEAQDFSFFGMCSDPDYPSGALFQKPTDQLRAPASPLFREA